MSINTFDKNDMPNSERQQGLQVALASYKVQLRMIPISQLYTLNTKPGMIKVQTNEMQFISK